MLTYLKKFINEKKLGDLKYCVIEYSQKIIPEKFLKNGQTNPIVFSI